MKKQEIKELAGHVRTAIRLANEEAAKYPDDGGTCNMDTVILSLSHVRMSSLEAAGISAYRLGSFIALSISGIGMAEKRTAAVQAAAQHLKDQGYPAHVWYQMD